MPASVGEAFTYAVPEPLAPGTLVEAKLGSRPLIGAVWDDAAGDFPAAKLKPITRVLDYPLLEKNFRQFIDWVAEFTLAPRGAVLSLCGLAFAAKVPKKPYVAPQFKPTLPTLSPEQQTAADALVALLSSPWKGEGIKPMVLDGVTGSGKTEVYFHAIAEAIQAGGQVLVLVPEIVLTHQWLERFTKTFGAAPAVWHSQQTPVQRARLWQAVVRGEAPVVVGARSALFLPFKNLALIIVDEEHDLAYKQEDGVLYHARDMAVVRAQIAKIPVVLVSATPSLETLENMREGKYRTLHLPQRYGQAVLPEVTIIDMVADAPERGEFLSPRVKQEMLAALENGMQSLLFLNRRGYAPLLLCRACGHRFQCTDCSAWLVVHGGKGGLAPSSLLTPAASGSRSLGATRLECHHCGHKEPMPNACPQCQAGPEKLAPCGPGVERIAEEVRGMFGISTPPPSFPSPLRGGPGRGASREHLRLAQESLIQDRAKDLRHNATEAEKKLWAQLRSEQLETYKFRRQMPFDHFIADFVCLERRLVIELDGGQHNMPETIEADKKRSVYFEQQGFHVLRFWNHEVMENIEGVMETIRHALAPPIQPSPAGGEGFLPRIAVLSSDEAIAAGTWAAIERGEVDILIGTQMVAKGHHFPNLTFVGVVDADLGLEGADLRASERTYQLLHQLGGRAGRGDNAGKVFVQTYQPNHPVMKALARHDRDGVMKLELDMRRQGGWPPFGQLAAILLDGMNEANVKRAGQLLAQSGPVDKRIQILGPAPAPLSKLRGQYRFRILVKASKGIHLQKTLRNWLSDKKFPGVRIKLDVNPYYFL
jgi:primosomal protein N'/very-short-patch-repair endonuclease